MIQKMFVERNFYTRDQIHDQLGGEKQTYLPMLDGKVVCVCLTKEDNPKAPEVVLVGGEGKTIVKRAEILSNQVNSIPVFMKDCSNSWRCEGYYVADGYKTDAATIQKEIMGSGRTGVVAGILYLKKVIN